MNKKRLILIACIVLFIVGIIFYPDIIRAFSKEKSSSIENSSGKNTPSGKNIPLNVVAQIIEPSNLIDFFPSMGNLMLDEEVDLSFETSGKITNIYFKEGSIVIKPDC